MRNKLPYTGLVLGLLISVVLIITLSYQSSKAPAPLTPHVKSTIITTFTPGPVFTFSLKPGGVHSAVDAGLPHGHAEVLAKDTWAFVSYKRHGEVFWTKHLVLLHAGETLYVDGDKVVRGRCGNGVAFLPKAPVEAEDVSEQLDLLEVPVQLPPEIADLIGPDIGAPGYLVPPPEQVPTDYPEVQVTPIMFPGPPVYLPGGGVTSTIAVPEPSEVGLLILGLAAILVILITGGRKWK